MEALESAPEYTPDVVAPDDTNNDRPTKPTLPNGIIMTPFSEIEPETVYVYGRCSAEGLSWISTQKQNGSVVIDTSPAGIASCFKENLFPKDKWKKFKLVLVEED